MPKLGEQALAVSTVRLARRVVGRSGRIERPIEKALLAKFPEEIEHIWSRLGTAEVATDPMGIELTDFFIALKPREQWKQVRTQTELIAAMRKVFSQVPGMTARSANRSRCE